MRRPFFIEAVTSGAFSDRVLRSELPVLVLIHANGINRGLLKLLEDCEPDVQGRVTIVQLSATENGPIPESLKSSHGMALFSEGLLSYYFVGRPSKKDLEDVLLRADRLNACRKRVRTAPRQKVRV